MKKYVSLLLSATLLGTSLLSGCGTQTNTDTTTTDSLLSSQWKETAVAATADSYRSSYEIFVSSFYDSDQDGTGDLHGITEKLDYLNDGDPSTTEDLGITQLWLMPVMPSPTYHKYDTTNYLDIDSAYGTLEDFQTLLEECHKRDMTLILDLAMNHTSSSHPWFTQAVSYLQQLGDGNVDSAKCPYVDYYHFTKNPTASTYYNVEGTDWYYEGSFWDGMPDLDLSNEQVRGEFEAIADYWLSMGVDGFRLDAVGEYESDNPAYNIETLSWFQHYVKTAYPDSYLVGECWQDQDTYASYYESGMDSFFDFAFANTDGIIAQTLKKSNNYTASTYGKCLEKEEALYASYSSSYINAPFYTNHDMGRSAGYYAGEYAQAQTKMAQAMNLFMSGNTFLYYGEELGMKGSGKDENKRAPMQWSTDTCATGMCDGPADMDDVEMKYGSLEEQSSDETSIYHFVKDALLIRNQNPVIPKGATTFLEEYSDDDLCVLTKTYEDTTVLIAYNLSDQEKELTIRDYTTCLGELDAVPDTAITLEDDCYTMPAYSCMVLGK